MKIVTVSVLKFKAKNRTFLLDLIVYWLNLDNDNKVKK